VKQVVEYSRPYRSVAEDLGIKVDTLRRWASRAKREGFEVAKAEESDVEAENRRLRKELKDKTDELYWAGQENEFLKKRRASSLRSRTQSVVRSDRRGEAELSGQSHV